MSNKKAIKIFLWGTFFSFLVAFFPFWGVELGMLIQGVLTGEYCEKITPCGNWGLLQWFYPIWLLVGAVIWVFFMIFLVVSFFVNWYQKNHEGLL